MAEIFEDHIYGTEDYIPTLKNVLEVVGIELKEKKNTNLSAQYFGLIAVKEDGKVIIKKVEPNSVRRIRRRVSGQNFLCHMSVDIGQTEISNCVTISKCFVVDSKDV